MGRGEGGGVVLEAGEGVVGGGGGEEGLGRRSRSTEVGRLTD